MPITIDEIIYRGYVSALIDGERARCSYIVSNLIEQNVPVYDLYVDLFQRSMYEIGELWETNKVSVATEHLATSITESLLSLVYLKIFSAEHNGMKAVVACIANEYHQIGGKMVADIFEIHGWDGYFLGSNTPVEDLLALLSDKRPDILGLSLSICSLMPSLNATIEKVRNSFPSLPILVGGQAFRWGGTDMVGKFSEVRLVPALKDLEKIISES